MGIPVIDMANINGEDRANIMAHIARGCESPGFFQLLNHGIDHDLMDRVKKICKEHYKLNREKSFNESQPVKIINSLIMDELNENDSGESKTVGDIDWEDLFVLGDLEKTDSWPEEPQNFKETMEAFQGEIYKLAEILLDIISENLGLEKDYMRRALAGGDGPEYKPFFGTKVSYYPSCPKPDLISGLRPHTDAGGLILLFQDDEVPGLQVLSNGEWVDVEPLKHSIVIDVGDQIEVISGGRYRSAWHRIFATEDMNRLSVASYYNPAFNAFVYPAPQLRSAVTEETETQAMEEGPECFPTYPKFVFGDYMNVYGQHKYEAKEPRFKAVRAMYEQVY